MARTSCFWVGMLLLLGSGCGGAVKEEVIQVAAPADPLAEARAVLQRYVSGGTPSSEVTTFPILVEQVRQSDPAKADVLQKGLDEIQKSPREAAAKAKRLLQQL